jgi:8-oxo-dGTP diphosphatase
MTLMPTDENIAYDRGYGDGCRFGDRWPRLGSAVIVCEVDHTKLNYRILLGKRAKDPGRGQWVIPGGRINYGETIEQAGIREIKEETGLDIVIKDRLGVYEMIDEKQHRVIVYSIAEWVGGTLVPADDLSEARFFNCSELSFLTLSPFIRKVLEDEGLL